MLLFFIAFMLLHRKVLSTLFQVAALKTCAYI